MMKRSGTWAVVVIVVTALLATWGARVYWQGVARRTWPATQPATQPATASTGEQADKDLEALRETYVQVRQQGSLDSVVKAAREQIRRHPQHAASHLYLGQLLVDLRQYDEALDSLARCLELNPNQQDVQVMAGNLALMVRRIDDAEQHFRQAIALSPRSGRYRLHMAQVHLARDDEDQARLDYLEALRLDSALHEAYCGLSDLFARQGNLVSALTQIQKAIEATPAGERTRQVVYIRKKANLLRRDNQPAQALQTLQSLTTTEKQDLGVLEETATCWMLLGQPRRAAEAFELAGSYDPMNWRYPASAARWRIKAGDFDAADRHIDALRRIDAALPAIRELQDMLDQAKAKAGEAE
ncbi:MAG: tetratricopeptide repeat protein [Phycisphaeraceae bacterium]|nr:tetratricopeptide repeat protein [Phycisphaeraceae bacterium]